METTSLKKITAFTGMILMLFISCSGDPSKESTPRIVKTESIRSHTTTLTRQYPGTIRASSDVRLSFRVAGPISKVFVTEGENVDKDQLLAKIDPRDYKIQLQATEARYHEVKAEAERIMALHKKGKVSDNEYDKAVSGLKQITAKYESHKNALEDTRLMAPYAGNINKIFFDSNETVDAGMPVVSLTNTQQFEIVTHIPAAEYLNKNQFEKFTCRPLENPQDEWPLALKNIVSEANLNGLYPMYFNLKNPDEHQLLSGMSVEVTITYKTSNGNLFIVPSTAIFKDEKNSKVWLLDTTTNTVHHKPVKIIRINTSGQAIVEGRLQAGATVISAGVHSLHQGEQVSEMEEPSKSNVGNLL